MTVTARLEYVSRSLAVAAARRANDSAVSFKGGRVGLGSRELVKWYVAPADVDWVSFHLRCSWAKLFLKLAHILSATVFDFQQWQPSVNIPVANKSW